MNIKCWGDGEHAFLGIHGWAGNHRTFKPLGENAPPQTRFYSVDLPGYGDSPAPDHWDIENIAGELVQTIGEITPNKLTLVGYCGGAALGVLVASRIRQRVSRLVLLDPFAYMPWYFRIFTLGKFGRRAYMATFASERGRRITNAALNSKRTGDTDLTKSFESVNHDLTLAALRAFTQFPSYTTFSGLHVDVDLVYGDQSFGAVKRGVQLWKKIWPHARIHKLHNAGHDPIREATPQLIAIVFGQNL
jgi:pimeloyl-ACP methyl ester carboxylesterase